jgi:siroheme synthase (precorrin-2 oxidase/ferrochelatase)
LEVYDCLAAHDPDLCKAVGTTGNSCMLAPEIQKDIVEYFANEVVHSILEEIGDDVFCLLVDESRDVSCKGRTNGCGLEVC